MRLWNVILWRAPREEPLVASIRTQPVQDKLRERWYDQMFASDRAGHFFVGNIAAHPRTFMLLSVFCPKANVVQCVQCVQDSPFGD
ncbi:hypothetical protein ACFY6U_04445 [Streptomyces sp. NPDC013157]|uniref:hypothetical protein n=1 Tax=Streptomyces sp. NPDC013157 TaxID=3364861 RepID=UPI0036B14F8D